jgi:hypothetical protein
VLECDDTLTRNFFRLLDKLFNEFFGSKSLKESKCSLLLILA